MRTTSKPSDDLRAAETFVRLAVTGLLTLCLGASEARADIYKFVDHKGVVHYADRPLGPGYRLILRSKSGPKPKNVYYATKNKQRFEPLIAEAAEQHKLDTALVHAVITAESGYDPNAESTAGAVGLMQLMPATAYRYGVKDRRNPTENVYAGVRYLRDLLKHFKNLTLALAAYNAGEDAVAKHGNRVPPYPETQDYIRKVLSYYRAYQPSS